ncbi:MAG: phenylacetic acid degradation operon negative regulatory protein PaaX [Proteobacteria bacterium]|nr:phenylacetic acid degradation operon negative regulatory protein PaaX [Pseudomonadota bacterium]
MRTAIALPSARAALAPDRYAAGREATIARWITRTLASDPPRTRSLIVTMWGDALVPHGGHVWLTTLIRLLASFAVSERLVRTSVFRLVRDGWLAGEPSGRRSRYRLTADGERRFAHAHQRIYAPADGEWSGDWELVIAPPDAVDARLRRALCDELCWEGYGQIAPTVHARPLHGITTARGIVDALGLSARVVVARARDDTGRPGGLAARVIAALPLAAVAADYRRLIARFGRVIDRFRTAPSALDPAQCFVVRTLLIHAYRRVLLRDPQLPAPLLPSDWPAGAAYELTRDFYRLTHAIAERHLAAAYAAAGEPLPRAGPAFYRRFGGLR